MALVLRYIPEIFTPNGSLVNGPDEKGKYKLTAKNGVEIGLMFPEDPHRLARLEEECCEVVNINGWSWGATLSIEQPPTRIITVPVLLRIEDRSICIPYFPTEAYKFETILSQWIPPQIADPEYQNLSNVAYRAIVTLRRYDQRLWINPADNLNLVTGHSRIQSSFGGHAIWFMKAYYT